MKRYGLIGHPLKHSQSRVLFNEKFEYEGLDCRYQNFDLKSIEGLSVDDSRVKFIPKVVGILQHAFDRCVRPLLTGTLCGLNQRKPVKITLVHFPQLLCFFLTNYCDAIFDLVAVRQVSSSFAHLSPILSVRFSPHFRWKTISVLVRIVT